MKRNKEEDMGILDILIPLNKILIVLILLILLARVTTLLCERNNLINEIGNRVESLNNQVITKEDFINEVSKINSTSRIAPFGQEVKCDGIKLENPIKENGEKELYTINYFVGSKERSKTVAITIEKPTE